MAGGQPTKYNAEMLEKANDYILNYGNYDHVMPSVVGLAVLLGVSKKTIYNWANTEGNEEFLHALSILSTGQEFCLMNKGLKGEINPAITRLIMATNHGYSEKPKDDNDEVATPLSISFEVSPAKNEIKTTNAKP